MNETELGTVANDGSDYFNTYEDTHYFGYNYTHYLDYDNTSYLDGYDYYGYDYTSFYYDFDQDIYYYIVFDFEPVLFYIWVTLIIITTLANILVMVVLRRRDMRNATNTLLIAIAISDTLSGLVTLPVTFYAYKQLEYDDEDNDMLLSLTKHWCEAFILSRYFINRAFHTMSIWLTVVLGFQRLISVLIPFRAQRIFTIRNTLIIIFVVVILSPFLHIYHAFDRNTFDMGAFKLCSLRLEYPCKETCANFWLAITLMHYVPCLLLLVSTIVMMRMMKDVTKKMRGSHSLSNNAVLQRRQQESKRISWIVIAVVIVFFVPEILHGVFLLVQVNLNHAKKKLLELRTSHAIVGAYEILLVLSFHANFWIYLIMSSKFRRGLQHTFAPIKVLIFSLLRQFVIQRQVVRDRAIQPDSDLPPPPDAQAMQAQLSSSAKTETLEMKTCHFDSDRENKAFST